MIETTYYYFSPVTDRIESVTAFCASPDSEVVAHLEIQGSRSVSATKWVLSHRRCGRGFGNLSFEKLGTALAFAAVLDAMPEFSRIRIGSLDEPPIFDGDWQALGQKVLAALRDFCRERGSCMLSGTGTHFHVRDLSEEAAPQVVSAS